MEWSKGKARVIHDGSVETRSLNEPQLGIRQGEITGQAESIIGSQDKDENRTHESRDHGLAEDHPATTCHCSLPWCWCLVPILDLEVHTRELIYVLLHAPTCSG